MPLRQLRASTAAQLAATFLVLSMSGAARASLALAPEREHRCQCASHGEKHRCACKICNERARRARRGELDKLPPCCRSKAAVALAAEEERDRQESADPCVLPDCGGGDPTAPPRASVEAFTLPEPAGLARPGRTEQLFPPGTSGPDAPSTPDVPPPRRA